jgi:hypothetical protein
MDQSATTPRLTRRLALAGALSTAVLMSVLPAAAPALANDDSGAVYTMTNATSGNAVLAFRRGGRGGA